MQPISLKQQRQQIGTTTALPPVTGSHTQHDYIRVHATYLYLMSKSQERANDSTLARVLSSWRVGKGGMPAWLGLKRERFEAMFARHFGDARWHYTGLDREEVDFSRAPEMDDLRTLLLDHSVADESSIDMAEILVVGCLGQDHLWQDLGLWSRQDLSQMIAHNFPTLAKKNDKNMKWKKFFYKQLCEGEGVFVCRSPSCEICVDYVHCFSPD